MNSSFFEVRRLSLYVQAAHFLWKCNMHWRLFYHLDLCVCLRFESILQYTIRISCITANKPMQAQYYKKNYIFFIIFFKNIWYLNLFGVLSFQWLIYTHIMGHSLLESKSECNSQHRTFKMTPGHRKNSKNGHKILDCNLC